MKVLEIGLGCNMEYGPVSASPKQWTVPLAACVPVPSWLWMQGASAQVWKEYLPNAEIWFAEYDGACVERYRDKLRQMNIKVVVGDQADNATLQTWLRKTGGNFDVIIVSSANTAKSLLCSSVYWH